MNNSTLDRYLLGLPNGWSSYPKNMVHRDLIEVCAKELLLLAADSSLPEPLRQLAQVHQLGQTPKYVSDVAYVALLCAMRDRLCDSDQSFIFLVGRITALSSSTSLFRQFLSFVPAKMMVITASSLWERAHPGTTFTRHATHPAGFEVKLSFPKNLYPELILRAIARSIRVMVGFSKQKDIQADLKSHSDVHAHLVVCWRRPA